MAGKTVLITGATDGIGKEAAKALAGEGANVIIVGRNPRKTETALADIRKASKGGNVQAMLADLSMQSEVRRLAAEFKANHARLDVLINNAGVIQVRRKLTPDGFEMTWAVNHLAYFLLTHELLDLLTASASSRILNTASSGHYYGTLRFANLQPRWGYTFWGAYTQSKLANVVFTYELARRLEGTGVTANAVHPGLVATNLGRNNGPLAWLFQPLVILPGISPQEGARPLVYLASAPEMEKVTGKYFDRMRMRKSSAESYGREVQRRLWEVSEEMVGMVKRKT